MTRWKRQLAALEPARRVYMDYLNRSLPYVDLCSYPFELFLEFVDHGLMLREQSDICLGLDEDTFRQYVLFPRVNDEELVSHRPLFYGELTERVKGLPLEAAALEVNVWCCEHVVYKAQDRRTASPIALYNAGEGRCGEESVFLVSALRSVGIPARQVYAPWWSHCGDNHAWVEVLCGDKWRYMGACEPERELDRGWFTEAASRALYIRSKRFTERAGTPEGSGGLSCANETYRYAKTHLAEPVMPSGDFVVEILNEGQFRSIINGPGEWPTDEGSLHLGLGDYRISHKGAVPNPSQMNTWLDFDFSAPESTKSNTDEANDTDKAWKSDTLSRCETQREARREGFFDAEKASRFPDMKDILEKARGNFGEIFAFLSLDGNPLRKVMLRRISAKDLRDVTAHTLEDHLRESLVHLGNCPNDIFGRYLMNPRISYERLTPWRAAIKRVFTKNRLESFRQNPHLIWDWIQANITTLEGYHGNLLWTPDAAISNRCCHIDSLPLLFMAIARTSGLAARLRPLDGAAEYWHDGGFTTLHQETHAALTLTTAPGTAGGLIYGENWTLGRFDEKLGLWKTLNFSGTNHYAHDEKSLEWTDSELAIDITPGLYRLITSYRLPTGDQLASEYYFKARQGQETQAEMRIRNPEAPCDPLALSFWLTPGEEPSEHIINELIQNSAMITRVNVPINIYAPQTTALTRLAENCPCVSLASEDNIPGGRPIYAAVNETGKRVYTGSGYNVGIVSRLLRMACAPGKQEG